MNELTVLYEAAIEAIDKVHGCRRATSAEVFDVLDALYDHIQDCLADVERMLEVSDEN